MAAALELLLQDVQLYEILPSRDGSATVCTQPLAEGVLLVFAGRMQLIPRPDACDADHLHPWAVALDCVTFNWRSWRDILVTPRGVSFDHIRDKRTVLRIQDEEERRQIAPLLDLPWPPPMELSSTETASADEHSELSVLSSSAASAISSFGSMTASHLRHGSQFIRSRLDASLESFIEEVKPSTNDSTPTLPASAEERLRTARRMAGTAEGVTRCVGMHVAAVASAVGAEAGEAFRNSASGNPMCEAIVKVGGASLSAASEVFDALGASTTEVVATGARVAAGAVSHKYGEGAGRAAEEGLGTAISATTAAINLSTLFRKSARAAASSAVESYTQRPSSAGMEMRVEHVPSHTTPTMSCDDDVGSSEPQLFASEGADAGCGAAPKAPSLLWDERMLLDRPVPSDAALSRLSFGPSLHRSELHFVDNPTMNIPRKL